MEEINATFSALFTVLKASHFPHSGILAAESGGVDVFQCHRMMGNKLYVYLIYICRLLSAELEY
jgi:hypothetical protein